MNSNRKCLLLVIALAIAFSAVACGKSVENSEIPIGDTVEITDMEGNQVELDGLPERIVSLLPSNTEIIFSLGAEDKLVGITTYCDYPEATKDIEKIGDFENPNIELIKKLKPDVVLAGGYAKEDLVTTLEGLRIPVIFTEAYSFDKIYESIQLIGKLVNEESKAEKILEDMRDTIDDIKLKIEDKARPRIFYVSWVDPLITAGKGTFIHDIIEMVGAQNIAEDNEGWIRFSVEKLVKENPDMIISAFHATDVGMGKDDIMDHPMFKSLDCVKEGSIYVMKDDNLIARPGPRIIEAIAEMAEAIHGDIF